MYRSGVGVLKYKGANGKLGTNAMQGGSQAWPSGRHHTDLVNCFSLYPQIQVQCEFKYNWSTAFPYIRRRFLDKSAGGNRANTFSNTNPIRLVLYEYNISTNTRTMQIQI